MEGAYKLDNVGRTKIHDRNTEYLGYPVSVFAAMCLHSKRTVIPDIQMNRW